MYPPFLPQTRQVKIMNSTEYNEFLKTDTWKQIARKRAAIDGYRCCMCGSIGTMNNPLQVHHVTYRHIGGNEDVYRDLVTLCRSCHRSVHIMMNRITDETGKRGWKDSMPLADHVLDV